MTSEETSRSLLVLAAGMGSRYGGLKQVDPVGPNGETLLDYSLYDARKAGFSRVVFLIRKEMYDIFERQVGGKYSDHIEVEYAFQEIEDLPENIHFSGERKKPWGTGHAVWCARHALAGRPFSVINADDFYGSDTFGALVHALAEIDSNDSMNGDLHGAIVGYKLRETLSEHGAVSRGICKLEGGRLISVEEWSEIAQTVNGINGKNPDGIKSSLTGEEVVSMNVWALPPGAFEFLDEGIVNFFENSSEPSKDEFYLPSAIDNWISTGKAVFKAQLASCKWMGVTYREDKPVVMRSIEGMIKKGEYPSDLF